MAYMGGWAGRYIGATFMYGHEVYPASSGVFLFFFLLSFISVFGTVDRGVLNPVVVGPFLVYREKW